MDVKPCPVCASPETTAVLRRDGVPVQQNLLLGDQRAAEALARGTLRLQVCERCGLLFNQEFDRSKLKYSAEYDSTQTCSPHFRGHVDGLVRRLVEGRGVRFKRIVEVACGRGDFLRRLVEAPGAGNTGVGFDPSYAGPLSACDGRLRFERCCYDADCGVAADVVLCRHAIGYFPDPVAVLRTVRRSLGERCDGLVALECQCAEWMLDHDLLFDFAYEVCSYFSADALATAFAAAGLAVTAVERLFGGQYLWVEGRPAAAEALWFNPERGVAGKAKEFSRREAGLRRLWAAKVREWARQGKLAVWGAGTKGACFASLVDPGRRWIECVVDLNPNKQGKYLPGTGHPIVDYRRLPELGVTRALLLNPNYLEENLTLLRQAGVAVELVGLPDGTTPGSGAARSR
jgi:SAM-dependent methyltransferase